MTTCVFPGQGSQIKGMGGPLFDRYPDLVRQADEILHFSIEDLCLEDREFRLGLTKYTQPAMFVVSALSYLNTIEKDGEPDYLAGHSLGEYSALFAAGVFDFATGLEIVKKRAELMAMADNGAMAAVIGLNPDEVWRILVDRPDTRLWIANYNSPSQVVVAGSKGAVDTIGEMFGKKPACHIVSLKVSGAFHSPLMEKAGEEFQTFIKGIALEPPRIPVIANVSAEPYDAGTVKDLLVRQMTHAVRWTESIAYLLNLGETDFVEIGPGDVLTRLIGQIRRAIPAPSRAFRQAMEDIPLEAGVRRPGYGPEQVPSATVSVQPDGDETRLASSARLLGDDTFRSDYGLKHAYLCGGMYRGIASRELVVTMGRAGMMGFFGTGGLPLGQIEEALQFIRKSLGDSHAYGMNLLHNPMNPAGEQALVDLFLRCGVPVVEASAFTTITPSLVKYRLLGLKSESGAMVVNHHIIAKISRPEVAALFMSPPPEKTVRMLLAQGQVTRLQAELAATVPMADDICLEADSGGHTDQGVAFVLMPAITAMREEFTRKYGYTRKIRLGAAGGIGTPEAALAAFVMGADFILTGSINQCTVEAGTSDAVKSMLQQINIQDTEYAPAGDMFEMGAKIQVLSRGVFFPARANKLYDIYRHCNSLEDIDAGTRKQLEHKYFHKSIDDIWLETCRFFEDRPEEIEKAGKNPKYKMSLIFRWYFHYTTQLALNGREEHKVNFQVHCGPALGAFNQWVKNTALEDWRQRHVDAIAEKIMAATAELFYRRFQRVQGPL